MTRKQALHKALAVVTDEGVISKINGIIITILINGGQMGAIRY